MIRFSGPKLGVVPSAQFSPTNFQQVKSALAPLPSAPPIFSATPPSPPKFAANFSSQTLCSFPSHSAWPSPNSLKSTAHSTIAALTSAPSSHYRISAKNGKHNLHHSTPSTIALTMPRPPKNKAIPEPAVLPVVAPPNVLPAAIPPQALTFKAPPVIDVDQFVRVRDSVRPFAFSLFSPHTSLRNMESHRHQSPATASTVPRCPVAGGKAITKQRAQRVLTCPLPLPLHPSLPAPSQMYHFRAQIKMI